jgi:hypothetical protein
MGATDGGVGDASTDAPSDAVTSGNGSSCAEAIDLTPYFDQSQAYSGVALGPAASVSCGVGATSVLKLNVAAPGNFRLDISGVTGPNAAAKPDAVVSIRTACDDPQSELRCATQVGYLNVYFGVPVAGFVYFTLVGDWFLDGYTINVVPIGTCSGFSGCSSFSPQNHCDDSGACVTPLFCPIGTDNCDNLVANGCEANLTSPQHCGQCNNVCASQGGTASCVNGQCALTCNPGFSNCDTSASNGCECGPDPAKHVASASCSAGVCTPTCEPSYTLCGSSCVDTQSSQSHCGACNTPCNGACHQGKCLTSGTTVGKLTSFDAGPLVIDATHAYFVDDPDESTAEVFRVEKAGGTPVKIAGESGIVDIAVDATYLYYATDPTLAGSQLMRVAKAGGTAEKVADVASGARELAIDATHAYLVSSYGFNRYPLGGGAGTLLFNQSDLHGVVLGPATAYVGYGWASGGGKLHGVPKAGGTVATLMQGLAVPRFVAADASAAYISTSSGVHKVVLGSGATSDLLPNLPLTERIVSHGGYLYFVNEADITFGSQTYGGYIGRVPTGGGPIEHLATITYNQNSDGIVDGLAVDATHVYWTQAFCCVVDMGVRRVAHD